MSPPFMAVMIRYVTPTFLIVILLSWSYVTLPGYLEGMNPAKQGPKAAAATTEQALGLCDTLSGMFADEQIGDDKLGHEMHEALTAVMSPPPERDELTQWALAQRTAFQQKSFESDAQREKFYCQGNGGALRPATPLSRTWIRS